MVMVGMLIVYNVFIEVVICEMVVYVKYLIIFLIFNLIKKIEVMLDDVMNWFDGWVLVVIGILILVVDY